MILIRSIAGATLSCYYSPGGQLWLAYRQRAQCKEDKPEAPLKVAAWRCVRYSIEAIESLSFFFSPCNILKSTFWYNVNVCLATTLKIIWKDIQLKRGQKQTNKQVALTSRRRWTYIKHARGRMFSLCSDYIRCAQDTLFLCMGFSMGRLPVWSSGKMLGQPGFLLLWR